MSGWKPTHLSPNPFPSGIHFSLPFLCLHCCTGPLMGFTAFSLLYARVSPPKLLCLRLSLALLSAWILTDLYRSHGFWQLSFMWIRPNRDQHHWEQGLSSLQGACKEQGLSPCRLLGPSPHLTLILHESCLVKLPYRSLYWQGLVVLCQGPLTSIPASMQEEGILSTGAHIQIPLVSLVSWVQGNSSFCFLGQTELTPFTELSPL